MPVVLDRLPLPNLTWYTGLSVLLLSCSVYYAGVQVTLNPNWKEKLLEKSNGQHEEEVSLYHVSEAPGGQGRHMTPYLIPEVISFMFHEPLCIWVRPLWFAGGLTVSRIQTRTSSWWSTKRDIGALIKAIFTRLCCQCAKLATIIPQLLLT